MLVSSVPFRVAQAPTFFAILATSLMQPFLCTESGIESQAVTFSCESASARRHLPACELLVELQPFGGT